MILRQGDVLLHLIDSMPDEVSEIDRGNQDLILAHGEVTGHAHRVASRHAKMYRSESDQRFMRVTAPVALAHEEHTAVTIPPGVYRVSIHAEYVPGALPRQVAD
jgi:hypothetical protein